MKCNSCNKTIDDDSKFCQFCGIKIEEKARKEGDTLWQQFIELSFEEDKDKRQKNRNNIPSSIREIVRRFSTNMSDSLKEENEAILDLSYGTLEDIKNSYYFLAEDGYWVYLAKRKLSGHKSHDLKEMDEEKLVEKWKEYFIKDSEKGKKIVDEEVAEIIISISKMQVNQLLENHEEIKKLPARIIEKIRGDLAVMPYWVYGCCLISERRDE